MKRFSLKKVAIVTTVGTGMLFIALVAILIYGVYFLYQIDPGIPGAIILVVSGAWVIYDLASLLNRAILEHLCDLDLAREDDE